MSNYLMWLVKGFGNNFLITILSGIIPLTIGVILTFVSSKSRICSKIFEWVSLLFECTCPIVVICAWYYMLAHLLPVGRYPVWIFVFALSFCFLGYMPARYIESYSFVKNIIYHGLGLFSALFKWSFLAGYIAIIDLLKATEMIRNRNYNSTYYLIPLLFTFIVLLILEVGRRLVKQLMK